MLPPPPVLAPPDGAADALALADTRGVAGEVEGVAVAVVGDGLGLGGGGGGGGGPDRRGGGPDGRGGGPAGRGGGDWALPPALPLRLTAETLALI